MEKVALAGQAREKLGTAESKRIRREGLVPATLYGHGMKPVSLKVSNRDFVHILHSKAGENAVVDLNVEGVKLKESTCLIKDIQHNPITDEIIHIDFTVISMNEKIDVQVHLAAINAEESIGVKEGGVLDIVHHEVEVNCLPTQIPEKIEVDVKEMNIGDAIHVKELKLPDGVSCNLEPDEVVIALHPPQKEEEAAPAAEGEEAAEPEVIEKGKKPEEGEEKAGDAAAGGEEKSK